MRIIANYVKSVEFDVPVGVILLSKKKNDLAKEKTPFSWRVEGTTLYYYDADGKEQEIDGEVYDAEAEGDDPDDVSRCLDFGECSRCALPFKKDEFEIIHHKCVCRSCFEMYTQINTMFT